MANLGDLYIYIYISFPRCFGLCPLAHKPHCVRGALPRVDRAAFRQARACLAPRQEQRNLRGLLHNGAKLPSNAQRRNGLGAFNGARQGDGLASDGGTISENYKITKIAKYTKQKKI